MESGWEEAVADRRREVIRSRWGGVQCMQRGSEEDVIDLTGSGETASERRCGGGAASTSYSAVPGWRRADVSIFMLHHAAVREHVEGALITPVCL